VDNVFGDMCRKPLIAQTVYWAVVDQYSMTLIPDFSPSDRGASVGKDHDQARK
jgi:hypothetical protein